MSTPFKMKGFSGFGNSPMTQKSHPAGTGFQNLKNLKSKKTKKGNWDIKGWLKGEQGWIPDYKGESTKKTVAQIKKKVSGTSKSDPLMVDTKLKTIELKEKNNPGTSWTWDPKTNTPKELKK